MTIRDALEQAEELLGKHDLHMMAGAWVELRNQLANAILDAYRAGKKAAVGDAEPGRDPV